MKQGQTVHRSEGDKSERSETDKKPKQTKHTIRLTNKQTERQTDMKKK